ncbi:MAG: hypothetical protein GX260_04245 [Tissierellia bacterium]|jgi:beta-lysine 5,6-aminomutase beta subunit|nr:OAM dimerization domain-containing protein [Bacillota bacterium]NLL22974.1 hypothetical protein [Tissierellia bacterium]
MSSGAYSMEEKKFDTKLDLKAVRPYGDTMNDGKVQMSFTLPVKNEERAAEAARVLARKMGLVEPLVAERKTLDDEFTFFVVYGKLTHSVNYEEVQVDAVEIETMTMDETDAFIRENFGRKLVVIGASTGTDAHTVGIDAIMNMKGYAGHFGLERYEMFDAYNLGSQVSNEEFIAKAVELKADILLVSQTVTQKDIHIQNLSELVELMEAENLRDKVILVAGGPRISHELAKELGYDAGFGPGQYADDVATFAVEEMVARGMK